MRLKPKRHPLVARQLKELRQFIQSNPTDAALWPDPFEMFLKSKTKRKKRRQASA